jgi:hypothetical protein
VARRSGLAYTVGQHIAFDTGRYAPETFAGRMLLAHELAHVLQQTGGGQPPAEGLKIARPADPAEREAEVAAEAVLQGHAVPPAREPHN